MATDMKLPNSDAVISAADDAVETYKAAGFTEVKAAAKRSTAKVEK